MSIQINGSGTITGISSGGLNDGIITDAELNLSANASNIKTALNASGSAPIYACRAWVNFNGTGTVAIRASGNVTSITDNGTGNYTINFTTAMPDTSFSCVGSTGTDQPSGLVELGGPSTTTQNIVVKNASNNTAVDQSRICVAIFR